MGYENPLLRLPAAKKLLDLPPELRGPLQAVLRELREQADVEAENSWARRKGPLACYWRAVATYARHMAHTLNRNIAGAKVVLKRSVIGRNAHGFELSTVPGVATDKGDDLLHLTVHGVSANMTVGPDGQTSVTLVLPKELAREMGLAKFQPAAHKAAQPEEEGHPA